MDGLPRLLWVEIKSILFDDDESDTRESKSFSVLIYQVKYYSDDVVMNWNNYQFVFINDN